MLYKIHNPRPASQGIIASGRRVFVKPGAGLILELSEEEAARAAKRVELSEIRASFSDKPDTFAHEFIADINRLQADRVTIHEVDPAVTNGHPNFDAMPDDELRSYAKDIGLKIHHKAGRAKILEALL